MFFGLGRGAEHFWGFWGFVLSGSSGSTLRGSVFCGFYFVEMLLARGGIGYFVGIFLTCHRGMSMLDLLNADGFC